ncbi:unnamed protein product [Gongylonema pulchrum]|uniref:Pecanex-like protein n=1 Tax=Gongylonema pulchrum TaxID=637853 RepID=A0A183EEY9_9BILA|nr:unnamed protein product [Gongylonema pulchrum]
MTVSTARVALRRVSGTEDRQLIQTSIFSLTNGFLDSCPPDESLFRHVYHSVSSLLVAFACSELLYLASIFGNM